MMFWGCGQLRAGRGQAGVWVLLGRDAAGVDAVADRDDVDSEEANWATADRDQAVGAFEVSLLVSAAEGHGAGFEDGRSCGHAVLAHDWGGECLYFVWQVFCAHALIVSAVVHL